MNANFWTITFLLLVIAFAFILPRLRSPLAMLFVSTLVTATSYGLYLTWGNSQHLKQYYSPRAKLSRAKHIELRPLLAEFRKEEFRLKARLEKDPNDLDAQWRLLDVFAIKALHDHEYEKALQYWESALVKIPNRKGMEIERHRISKMIETLRKRESIR